MCPDNVFPAILFSEDFESGDSPFSFFAERTVNDDYNVSDLINDCGSLRGRCWSEIFKPDRTDTYFGFWRTVTWDHSSTIYFRYYFKYGDITHPYSWITAERSHELKFPDFGVGSSIAGDGPTASRIIIKHRGTGTNGVFRVYTPNAQNHDLPGELISNRWYCIEFLVQDNGNTDTVKIWKNKNDESNPDYSFTSTSNMFASRWEERGFEFGYRNHAVASDQYFYFDDIVISDKYIGCGPATIPPSAPENTSIY